MIKKQIARKPLNFHPPIVIISIMFSGICWFFSNHLSGNYWYLLWLAPIPVLLISFSLTAGTAFLIAYIAYAIGRLSWFHYLQTVSSLSFAIILTLSLPLIFAFIIVLVRKIILKSNSWLNVFAFPVFFTASEWLMMQLSPDGTSSSLAYTQMNALPVIQIASVTGILGITFLVTFFPSAVTTAWFYKRQRNTVHKIVFVAAAILVSVFVFSIARLKSNGKGDTLKVGLAVADEALHNVSRNPDFKKEDAITAYYISQIKKLAEHGAKLIVLPEKAINIDKETAPLIFAMLAEAAKQSHVFIIAGYVNYRNNQAYNSALVINDKGDVITDYNKVFLVKGWEDRFAPGDSIGLFNFEKITAGVAICKDLDFPGYIRNYGKSGIDFLSIPAWDFVIDDWLHSRMAVLRGVENGFSEIRTAREGRLTVSDGYGRIFAEASSSNEEGTTLIGEIAVRTRKTLYTQLGDWFGILNIIAAACFTMFLINISNKKQQAKKPLSIMP